jgi:hypothetical protein
MRLHRLETRGLPVPCSCSSFSVFLDAPYPTVDSNGSSSPRIQISGTRKVPSSIDTILLGPQMIDSGDLASG